MSKFKVGDRVREISTGDIGVITRRNNLHDSWCVKYETGDSEGRELWSWEEELKFISNDSLNGTEIVIGGVTYILQRK